MSELPWKERVTMLSINPDAASREDVANMAAELMETWNHRRVTPQGGQPAEPVEGATALEKLIAWIIKANLYRIDGSEMDAAIAAARQEAANRRPATGEDERVAVDNRLELANKIMKAVDPDERLNGGARLLKVVSDILAESHLPAPGHSDVEPPWAKLRPFQTKQGVVRDKHGNMIAEAWGITNGDMICAALNGESK